MLFYLELVATVHASGRFIPSDQVDGSMGLVNIIYFIGTNRFCQVKFRECKRLHWGF